MDPNKISHAAALLRSGEVVAFPTETVYGLGADAENENAVEKIFELKGRPRNHPLIVHLADARVLDEWAESVSPAARKLMEAFWPGPLTLILKRGRRASDVVAGGHATVGLRVPSHPVAHALLEAFGGGIAAPSANRFGAVSPTTAEHVGTEFGDLSGRGAEGLGSKGDSRFVAPLLPRASAPLPFFLLDGGACEIGLESTIVDCSGDEPAILRPGGITREQVEAVLKATVRHAQVSSTHAPGMLASHYAPKAEVILARASEAAEKEKALRAAGKKVAVLAAEKDLEARARSLYAALREADARQVDVVLAILPDETGIGAAIADRLKKAAGPRSLAKTQRREEDK